MKRQNDEKVTAHQKKIFINFTGLISDSRGANSP
jgi:hypothetical protein